MPTNWAPCPGNTNAFIFNCFFGWDKGTNFFGVFSQLALVISNRVAGTSAYASARGLDSFFR